MSSLNKIRILENDEQKKTNPNSNEAFELGFVDSLTQATFCSLYQLTNNKSGCSFRTVFKPLYQKWFY